MQLESISKRIAAIIAYRVAVHTLLFLLFCFFIFSTNITRADEAAAETSTDSTNPSAETDRPDNCENGDPDEPTVCGGEEDTEADVGSSPNSAVQPRSWVANPINLMSGNKFQKDSDYAIPSSSLMLNRMYNSGTSDSNVGLGMGWRHSFAVSLLSTGETERAIYQSNGARLLFNADSTDENGDLVMRSVHNNHGYLIQKDNKHTWHLPDGRTLNFTGSFLASINWPDQRHLKLFYRSKRLYSVTDETGRQLVFSYYPGNPDILRGFDNDRFVEAAGFIESVTLPNGSEIKYEYDNNWNLSRVLYPDDTQREYHYESELYVNHLTGITDRTGVRYASWSYDANGRAISSEHANGIGKVSLQYPELKALEGGELVETIVTNSLGGKSIYTWQTNLRTHQPQLLSSSGAGCTTCPKTGYEFTYDDFGRLLSRTSNSDGAASGDELFTHRYDDQGRLVESKHINNVGVTRLIERTTYDSNFTSLPSRKTLPSINPDANRTVDFEYNERGQTIAITENGFEPDVSSLTERLKKAVAYATYNEMVPSIDNFKPVSRTTKFTYENGHLIEIDGPRSDVEDVTTLSYDTLSRLIKINTPLSPAISMSNFNADGQAQSIQIGSASAFTLERDIGGTVTSVTHKGMRYGYQHDAEKRLIGMTGPDGQKISLERDDTGRVVRTVDDIGRVSSYSHDSENRLVGHESYSVNGTLVSSLEYVFDTKGRISQSTEQRQQGDGGLDISRSISYEHGRYNYLSTVTDIASGASINIDIDQLQNITTRTMPNGASQQYKINNNGHFIAYRDTRKNTTAFLRDDFGRVVLHDSPDTGFTRYWYNGSNQRVKAQRENGSTTNYVWDAAGRLTKSESQTEDNSPITTAWRYNPNNGMLIEAINDASTDRFSYDDDGNLVSHTRILDGMAFTTSYTYDSRGRQQSKTLPDGQELLFSYHEQGPNIGSLQAIEHATLFGPKKRTLLSEIDLDARDGASGYRTQDGGLTQKNYNGVGEIQSLMVEGQLSLSYKYNSNSLISGIEENGTAQHYDYIGKNLVKAETITGDHHFQYDSEGNRVFHSKISTDGEQSFNHYQHAESGDGNRLLKKTKLTPALVQSHEYKYEKNGTPSKTGALRYEYNIDGRPIAVYNEERLIARYSYNSFGERVKKITYPTLSKPESTYFLYEGTALTAQINQNGELSAQYVYLNPNQPVLKLEGNEIYSIHTDHLGTPRVMSDSGGVAVWAANYNPFGEATIVTNTKELSLRLPGQYVDEETGTHYNYFRDYDPTTGRYLTSDPIGLNGGANTYAYTNNNPIALFDTTGLAPTAVPLDGPLSPGGWTITAEEYNALAALANAGERVEYYFMLHNITGSRLALEMAQISSNSHIIGGVAWHANYAILDAFPDLYPQDENGNPSIEQFSTDIFQADFNAVTHYACGVDGPIYHVPSDTDMIGVALGVWTSLGLGHVGPPLIRDYLDQHGDIAAQFAVGNGIVTALVNGFNEWLTGEENTDTLQNLIDNGDIEEEYVEALPYISEATLAEIRPFGENNGFYEPEFIRDHPGDVIETSYSHDCLYKIMRAPISSRNPNISEGQELLYNDVSGSPDNDVIVVPNFAPEYYACLANQ